MITEIQIKNCASFDRTGVTVKDLKEINFIYGPNGSGKTTISNVIADWRKYPQCSVAWNNNIELKSFVYNRNFIDENFGRSKTQKGIFTLGKGEKDAKETIEARKSEIAQINTTIISDIATIEKHNADNELKEVRFTEDCWKIYSQLKDIFKPAFKGCSFKATFKERCKGEVHNSFELLDLVVLKEKAGRIYSGSTEPRSDIALINYQSLQETEANEIWVKRIIGKDDVDIAAIIKRLNNSDWVKQGRFFYSGNGDYCPFCQQKAPENFEQQLNEYFDETYLAQLKTLNDLGSTYSTQTGMIVYELETLLNSNNNMIDNVRLGELKRMLSIKMNANKDKINSKIKEPGSVIELETLNSEMELINELIQTAREKIAFHNETVKHLSRESAQLAGEVWRYIADEINPVYQRTLSDNSAYVKIIEGLEMSISGNEGRLKMLRNEIAKLEILGTNIVHTITEINILLGKFGFTSFKLAEATDEKGSYQVIRSTGERVERTLSEGEKTVITFLYFYHLVKGSVERDSINDDRIIVFDDPISSLDGHALFIVSHLIRSMIEEIRSKKSIIKQIIVLTHNVNFHKEVSYQIGKGLETFNDQTFWILRKEHDFSYIRQYERNPIRSSYELMWREVKENPDSITLDITLRRIIENYFKAFDPEGSGRGLGTTDELLNELDEEDKMTANSLLSWSNENSNGEKEDLYVTSDSERYLKVFRTIFEKTNHIEHYNLMMGIDAESEHL